MTEEQSSIIEFSEDISQAEQPEPLPLNDYPFNIRAVEAKIATASGNKYAAVTCYISPDDYPADFPVENAPDGVTIIYRGVPLSDTPQNRWRLRGFCDAIGAPMSNSIDLNEWIGLSAVATVDQEEYEGVMRNVIKRVKAE